VWDIWNWSVNQARIFCLEVVYVGSRVQTVSAWISVAHDGGQWQRQQFATRVGKGETIHHRIMEHREEEKKKEANECMALW
jgi:hypothetical protein